MTNMESQKTKTALFLTGEMGLGGGAMFVLNLCEGLRESRGDWCGVAGVFTNLGEIGSQMRDRGLHVIGPYPDALLHEDYMEAMHADCAKLKPDAVIANLGGDAFDFLRFIPPGVLRIGIIHSDRDNVYRLVKAYAPWLDVVVAVSRHAANHFSTHINTASPKVTSVSCGIPISSEVRKPRSGATLRVLYLGRLIEEQKRVGLMSRIIRESITRNPSIEWTLIGDGPDLPAMRKSFEDLKESVIFTGGLDYSEVRQRLPQYDVFFLCSDYEGLPLSMLEAMSAGLVPIVSNLKSGISEVVHDGNGIRVDIDDESGYVQAILDLSNDNLRLERMSLAARLDVSLNYSVSAMTRRWEDLLQNECKSKEAIWELHGPTTIPPIATQHWFHHPKMRPLRRALKRLQKPSR